MRWEAFKARNFPVATRDAEPPHVIRQQFTLSNYKVEHEGATSDVYSVAPMKFNGDTQALAELDPSVAATRAVLYLTSLQRRSWNFIAQLAEAGLRVDIPLNCTDPTSIYAQLVAQHGRENVSIIADGPAAVSAIAVAPHVLILNSPSIRRPPKNLPAPSSSEVHIWSGSKDESFTDAATLAKTLDAEFHGAPGAIPLFHLTSTPEGRTAVRNIIHIALAS